MKNRSIARITPILLSLFLISLTGFAQGTQLHSGHPIYSLSSRIGIGTANPTMAPLHISANTNLVQLRLERTGSSSGISADIGGHSGHLIFYPGGYPNKNGNVYFNTTGKVGIGTEAPEDILHIFSPAANGSRKTSLLIDGYSQSTIIDGSSQVIRFKGNAERYWGAIGGYTANSKEGMGIFAGNSTSLTTTPGLYLNSDQNVGIGTTSPNERLSVIGQDVSFYSQTASNSLSFGRDGSQKIRIDVQDHHVFFDYYQDADENQSHILHIRNRASGTSTDNDIRFSTGGAERLTLKNDGKVGIGTSAPNYPLSVAGRINSEANGDYYGAWFGGEARTADPSINVGEWHNYRGTIYWDNTDRKMVFETMSSTLYPNTLVLEDGNVGIGVGTPGEKLEVNGTIRSKKVKVEANGWPDYVFAKNYDLRTLTEVEDFIEINQHLPDVPSAKEIETHGLDLGNMDATLLKKVEELTLYMIEMKKEIELLKQENKKLSKEVKTVKK